MATGGLRVSPHKLLSRARSAAGSLPFIQQTLIKGLRVSAIGPGSGDITVGRCGSPLRSFGSKCGNKYGTGESSIGVVLLLALSPIPHEKLGWGRGSQGRLPRGCDTPWFSENEE